MLNAGGVLGTVILSFMRSLVCICCGEAMSTKGNAFSRNPNLCASCSSMEDGMSGSDESDIADPAPPQPEPQCEPAPLLEKQINRGTDTPKAAQ